MLTHVTLPEWVLTSVDIESIVNQTHVMDIFMSSLLSSLQIACASLKSTRPYDINSRPMH